MSTFTIRRATEVDILALRTMQQRAMITLGGGSYTPGEIAAFLNLAGTMEGAVLSERHFFLAENEAGQVMGSGGWSRLPPRYGRPVAHEPARATMRMSPGAATVRSVFVAPEFARQGIGRAIMARTEADAAAAGIFQLHVSVMLSAEAFYRALGYQGDARSHIELADGTKLDCVLMRKFLVDGATAARPSAA
jgi:predicted N-acetyltransferase YhbS